jgi:hypothetical protein
MKTAKTWLRVLLGVAAGYHIVLGLLGIFFKSHAAELARELFRFNLSASPDVLWMINPFSAYMLAFGSMLAVTASNPLRFRPMVFVAGGLFALRVVQRVIFITSADEALKTVVSPGQNLVHLAVVSAMGLAMLVLAMRVKPLPAA